MHYLLTLNADYANEFDVNAFQVLTEEEWIEGRETTDKFLAEYFKKENENTPLTKEQFKGKLAKSQAYTPEGQYQAFTYDLYLTNPNHYRPQMSYDRGKTYEMGFGTNEALQWNSAEDYWCDVNVKEISDEDAEAIIRTLGSDFGTCSSFFPLGEDE